MTQQDEQRHRVQYEAWLRSEAAVGRRGSAWLGAVMRPTGATRIQDIPLEAMRVMYQTFHTPCVPGNGIVIY